MTNCLMVRNIVSVLVVFMTGLFSYAHAQARPMPADTDSAATVTVKNPVPQSYDDLLGKPYPT